jgi:hypothetical protein
MKNTGLRVSFCLLVLGFALFHFADNVADPDLWGHVLFGQRMLKTGGVEKSEPFSWTAPGAPWINHEVLAEIALGASHALAGGAGILLLKVLVGMLTFWIALRLGAEHLAWPWRSITWILGLIASVEISFGFAARPQIFSALGLAVLFWILRRVFDGRKAWAVLLPLLFFIWINTHGGALAGLLLLGIGFAAWCFESLFVRREKGSASSLVVVGVAVALSAAAMLLNPWGLQLPVWLIESVSWVRPEIHEWNPIRLDIERAPFFMLLGISAVSLLATRRRRALWEMTVLAVLAVMALRHVRHTPLFSIAALAFIPPHAADAVQRIRTHVAQLEASLANPRLQRIATVIFLVAAAGCFAATGILHKNHPRTMEIPADIYPVSAIHFMQEQELKGNLLVFFDWGEMAIWELPDNPVSMDGRLDTCYPRKVITANWDLYRGVPPDPSVLNIRDADVALLREDLGGAEMLIRKFGWRMVYRDPLAVVLIRNPSSFPRLAGRPLPVERGSEAVEGSAAFPSRRPARVFQKF